MEGRATSARSSVHAKAPRALPTRLVLIVVLGVALLGAAFTALRWNAGRAEADAEFDAYTTVQATDTVSPANPTSVAGAAATPAQGGAMIVDDNVASDPTRAVDGLPSASSASAAAAPAKPAAATSQRKPRVAPAKGKHVQDDSSDLLATLMGIIKRDEKPATKQDSMDSLIAKIQAEDSKNATETDAAFDAIDSHSASTSSNVQTQLRKCPGANTMAGLECRKNICAALTGKDPACPAH
ncbi:conserved hypothetical protein [Xanthomonas citri pv. fuscans]|uniref:Secreted protein n=1 Tax=Xanthomonas campestris pv. phaseoli TaxID=317013 RepID=A0AB34QGG8_XANCH|nr:MULTISPECIES: hypothetical protein [Xanthomonas]ATS51779.1 hypothetical protein XcfCFBP6992P_13420 [Xanthomonas citri pv. phaseoli var. fuscans]ATS80293.1 hypothetical protein XcfCFBP7767P_11230 [Xanthomonas citri pv. phaseoli var. fuscans]KHS36260.1 hypothetical protein RN20_14485 [Xanthomonas phaseoli pv. phaseoli]SOO20425.1 conserved hypothetical protein [Xanthomonas citri pv. fuscans]